MPQDNSFIKNTVAKSQEFAIKQGFLPSIGQPDNMLQIPQLEYIPPSVKLAMQQIPTLNYDEKSLQATKDKLAEAKKREGDKLTGIEEKDVESGVQADLEFPEKLKPKRIEPVSRLDPYAGIDIDIEEPILPEDIKIDIVDQAFIRGQELLSVTEEGNEMQKREAAKNLKAMEELPVTNVMDDIYSKVSLAETRGLRDKEEGGQWWRRTLEPETPTGSSAFGPVQITRDLFADFKERASQFGMPKEVMDSLEFFIMQGDKFLEYGNEPNKEGYDPAFDYSVKGDNYGRGYFSGTEEANAILEKYGGAEKLKKDYSTIAKTAMKYFLDQYGGDMERFVERWRGKTRKENPKYYETIIGNE